MKTFMQFLKDQLGLARAETSVTKAESDCMASHASGRQCLVEIGVWHGVTTRRLREVMASDGILCAVDPYPVGRTGISLQREIALSEVSRVPNGRVEWVRETGAEAARRLAGKMLGRVEFVFIDGDHNYDRLAAFGPTWSPRAGRSLRTIVGPPQPGESTMREAFASPVRSFSPTRDIRLRIRSIR